MVVVSYDGQPTDISTSAAMELPFGIVLHNAGIDPSDVQVIRHAFVLEHEDSGAPGIQADSSREEILRYTSDQSANPRNFRRTHPNCGSSLSAKAAPPARRAAGLACGQRWKTTVKFPMTARGVPST